MRWIIALLLTTVSMPSAWADCNADVFAALSRILSSGPFHYERWEGNRYFKQHTLGELDPHKGEYQNREQNGARGSEAIYIGDRAWTNDGFGWEGPWGKSLGYSETVPLSPTLIVRADCLGTVDVEGRILNRYE